MRRTGFTLIELLVVIAIIAILAAILFPVFAKAREKARQSSCLSNFKQTALAIMSYAQDYDEGLPRQYFDAAGPEPWEWCNKGQYTNYQDYITPYVKNTQIFKCPSSQLAAEQATAWNSYLNGKSLGSLQSPSTMVMTLDSVQEWLDAGCLKEGNRVDSRHNDGFNANFLDGHAKWFKRSQMTLDMYNEGSASTPWS